MKKTLRIAQVAPLFESVPPKGYGGTERVVSYLTEALVEQGHQVTLFATGDSITSADLVSVCEHGMRTASARTGWMARQTMLNDLVFQRANEFDVMHFHVDCLHYPMSRVCPTPSVTTFHGRLDAPYLKALHEQFRDHPVVSISDHQRQALPDANYVATVYHGLPLGLYDFSAQPLDYFAFIGRISPEKRLDRAIEIAVACNTRLVVAAKIDDADREYYEREIAHLMEHPLVKYVGEVDDAGKNVLLGGARALLFPIDWPEPFGLVVIESLACGTPVVAYGMGSVPELLDDGVTGFVVDNQKAAIAAAQRVGEIDRADCRRVFEQRFSSPHMAQAYVDVYSRLAGHRMEREGDVEESSPA
ncbi:glycosyltransferase family 4 protein [Ramlibacter sp. PS4R-6]|uniref:glycosyltransferase family 4 protein n=1 Tax=Ramlibacter sp. PS4R-6 TaxID=3133438 RepID=UPI0030ACC174